MKRKFTVYGLRFSKTSFWNHINTGFPDPAVATALTACGIETQIYQHNYYSWITVLQQHLPLAVLKRCKRRKANTVPPTVATALTACGIETHKQ